MLQLFYKESTDRNTLIENHISSAGRTFEHFFVDEHRDEYDHANVDPRRNGCFCNLPDPADPKWPKLFNNYRFIASGQEEILALEIQEVPDIPLPHQI